MLTFGQLGDLHQQLLRSGQIAMIHGDPTLRNQQLPVRIHHVARQHVQPLSDGAPVSLLQLGLLMAFDDGSRSVFVRAEQCMFDGVGDELVRLEPTACSSVQRRVLRFGCAFQQQLLE